MACQGNIRNSPHPRGWSASRSTGEDEYEREACRPGEPWQGLWAIGEWDREPPEGLSAAVIDCIVTLENVNDITMCREWTEVERSREQRF